jgi:hypothetical protein
VCFDVRVAEKRGTAPMVVPVAPSDPTQISQLTAATNRRRIAP